MKGNILRRALSMIGLGGTKLPVLGGASVGTSASLPNKKLSNKGQLRAPKGKPSGAAKFKRAAKKRANIRAHSAK